MRTLHAEAYEPDLTAAGGLACPTSMPNTSRRPQWLDDSLYPYVGRDCLGLCARRNLNLFFGKRRDVQRTRAASSHVIVAHLTAYRGLLGLAIQAVIKLRLVPWRAGFVLWNAGPRLSGLILNDCLRLLAAFPTLEGEHLALYVSSERLTSDEGRFSPAVPANNRRDVSWDKRRLFGWSRHSAFTQIRRRERIGSIFGRPAASAISESVLHLRAKAYNLLDEQEHLLFSGRR
jgi:hypothetical protein